MSHYNPNSPKHPSNESTEHAVLRLSSVLVLSAAADKSIAESVDTVSAKIPEFSSMVPSADMALPVGATKEEAIPKEGNSEKQFKR